MEKEKIVILPCSGMGKAMGTVARQATYDLVEKVYPGECVTTCLALLVSGDEDALRLVKGSHCIALDGCAKECARKNIEMAGGVVGSELRVFDVLREFRDMKPETVINIGEGGERLAGEIVKKISVDVEKIRAKRGDRDE